LQKGKDITFIGFSVKSRRIVYGINQIINSRKKLYLLILCKSASENTKKEARNFAKNHAIKILITKDILLEEIVNKINCKSAALTDKNLAVAVLDNVGCNLTVFDEVPNYER
jgi:hypothetical protein